MPAVVREVRDLDVDDVETVVELATLCEIAETGASDPELVSWIRAARPQRYRLFGLHDDAGLAAFAVLECGDGHSGLEADVRVRPGLSYELADPLLARLRTAAAGFDPAKPVHLFTNATAARQHRWLQGHGGREVRRFWRMGIDLDDAEPTVPPLPPGCVLRRARDDGEDLRRIFAVTEAAFAEHFGHTGESTYEQWIETWHSRAGFDLSLWWVVELDGAPVAALLGITFPQTGHVGTLGTLEHARGRGIGTFLLRTSFAEFHRRGLRRVTLGVDSENGTGAVRLYESAGMRAVNEWPLYELPPLAGQGPAGSMRSASNAV